MRPRAWHIIALGLVFVIGGVSATHILLVQTTSSAMDYHAAAGRLLSVGANIRTWVIGPLLVGAALTAWLLRGHRSFLFTSGSFGILWLHTASFEVFLALVRARVFRLSSLTRLWWNIGWVCCLTIAFALLVYGVTQAAGELSKSQKPTQTDDGSHSRAWQFSVWHLLLLVLAVSPFLAIARLVIPAFEMSLQEYFHWNWVYLLVAPIYFVFTLLIFRWWPSTKSLAFVAFSLGLGLQLLWYLLELSLGGDKIANVSPESPFYDLLLVRGPAQFWIPLVSDSLLLLATCLLYRDLCVVESRTEPKGETK